MDDLAGHLDRPWDAENMDDLVHQGHPVAGALVDRGAWAAQDADRWAGRRKATDHDCRWVKGHGFQLEEDRDFRSATDVEAERRVARKRQPQAGHSLADPAVAGQARADAERAERQNWSESRGVTAGREALRAQPLARMAVDPATMEQSDVELWELRVLQQEQ
jgi:hypothetical protein